ncbi:site-specific DNA-methyltransferase [Rhodothermus marinus]|uniref:site-specific DNA-methyltransferase n=1 Tax=Rhodothermus marinus TaxID=29549 RepID=UPI000B14AE82|nr:site-specific DNA-methyltransferase [Rhodothermus marinus]
MSNQHLPSLPEGFTYRLNLRHFVTPKGLRDQPIHRWFWFPHSFSPQLLDEILHAYPLPPGGRILDPFVGAGTTVLRALQLGYSAAGVDLSPLSLFVSRVKIAPLEKARLGEYLRLALAYRPVNALPSLPERMHRAFTPQELSHLLGLRRQIVQLPQPYADFFLLVLLRTQQLISRAVPDGGWFRWVSKPDQSDHVAAWFKDQAIECIADLPSRPPAYPPVQLIRDDARRLECLQGAFDLVFTSPPYPNRHDYSRIFHVELLTLGMNENEVEHFRRTSLRSHVEANAPQVHVVYYQPPPKLREVLAALPEKLDRRIPTMLKGYFEDLYLTLRALWPHLQSRAICAFVVGNVRHAGVMVPVDEILAQIAEQAGYTFVEAWVARLRGNSAQQMGRFGREPARETIVFLRKP